MVKIYHKLRFFTIFMIFITLLCVNCNKVSNEELKSQATLQLSNSINDYHLLNEQFDSIIGRDIPISRLTEMFGSPIKIVRDTFYHGRSQLRATNSIYDYIYNDFESIIKDIPKYIIWKYTFLKQKTSVYNVYTSIDEANPNIVKIIAIKYIDYDPNNYIPLYLTEVTNHSKSKLIELYGQPQSESIDSFKRGSIGYLGSNQELLFEATKEFQNYHQIQTFYWTLDSSLILIVSFDLSNDTLDTPLAGMILKEEYTLLE